MTGLSHLDPAFSNVVAIEAVNEPIMNASQTPGYGNCTSLTQLLHTYAQSSFARSTVQKNFVQAVRTMEHLIGIPVQGYKPFPPSPNTNFTYAMAQAASTIPNMEVQGAIKEAVLILMQIASEINIEEIVDPVKFWRGGPKRAAKDPLTTTYVFRFVLCL